MAKIQITFKMAEYDVAIFGDSVGEIQAEYDRLKKSLKLEPSMSTRKHARSVDLNERHESDSIPGRIVQLKQSGFFKQERTIQEVQRELARKGITKEVTSLSNPLKDLVRENLLSRKQKETGGRSVWVYVA